MLEQLEICGEKINKSLDALRSEYISARVGRANPHMLNKIGADHYGMPTPFQQVGNVTVPEVRMIQIQPWEKSLLREIEKAIQISDLGIGPTNDGNVIRPVFPESTEERRKKLTKNVKKRDEAAKVTMRNIRGDVNDTIKELEKSGEISEDERDDAKEQIQKLTDKIVEKADKTVEDKTKEIMTI